MVKQEFNGKTLDEALSAAARAFGTDVNLLSYNILPQASGGLLSKLFQRGVRLEAWIDNSNDVQAAAREAVRQAIADAQGEGKSKPQPANNGGRNQRKEAARPSDSNRRNQDGPRQRQPDNQSQRHQRGRPSGASAHPQRDSDRPIKRTNIEANAEHEERIQRPRVELTADVSKELLNELALQFVHGFDPEVTSAQVQIEFTGHEEVTVTVQSPTLEGFLIRSDRLSCAFEHLFKRIAQRRFGDVSGRVTLNAGSASSQREEKLQQLALDVAAKVKENGKTITLSSKSSQERRVIHLALENMEGIATKSVGVGENRKLIIYSTTRPQRERHQGRRGSNNNRAQGGRPRQPQGDTVPSQGDSESSEGVSFADSSQNKNGRQQPRRNRRRGRRGGGRQHESRDTPGDANTDRASVSGSNFDSPTPRENDV